MSQRRPLLIYLLCLLLPLSAMASPGTGCPDKAHAEPVTAETPGHAAHHGADSDSDGDHGTHPHHPDSIDPTAGEQLPCECCKVCADRCAALGSLSCVSILGLPAMTVLSGSVGSSTGDALTEDPDPPGLFRPPIINA